MTFVKSESTLGDASAPRMGVRAIVAVSCTTLLTAGAALYLNGRGFLQGIPVVLLAASAVTLVPSSRGFSRRIALNALLGIGIVQLLWALPTPGPRGPVLLALAVGVTAATVGASVAARGWRRTLPRIRSGDAGTFLAGALAAFALRTTLRTKSAAEALATLLPGWDNAGHFNMFRTALVTGETIDRLAPPSSGGQWHYFNYPQGYHALAASVADSIWPEARSSLEGQISALAQVSAPLLVVGIVILVASISAVPTVRRRPEVTTALGALVVAGFALGPGLVYARGGFSPFVFVTLLLATSPALAAMQTRPYSPLFLGALASIASAVASGWALLIPLAVPVALSALIPLRRLRAWGTPAVRVGCALVTLALAISVSRTARTLFAGDSPSLTLPGAIEIPPFAQVTLLALSTAALAVAGLAVSRRRPSRMRAVLLDRYAIQCLYLVTGALMVLFLARAQIGANGSVGYYTWKFLAGSMFFSLGMLCLGVCALVPMSRSWALPGAAAWIIAPLGAAAALQTFGYVGPLSPAFGVWVTASHAEASRQFESTVESVRRDASDLLDAADAAKPVALGDVYLKDPARGSLNPILAQQWFLALTSTWTADANVRSIQLDKGQLYTDTARGVGLNWLANNPGRLVVPPSLYNLLRHAEQRARLETWAPTTR